jgi:pSer/pThr/pTyr-binding forkhead associated (FHA) protein
MSENEFSNTEMEEGQESSTGEEQQPVEDQPEGLEESLPSQATITVKKDDETILEYLVDTLPVHIGRKSDNDIVLEEKNVSRKHAQIVMREDQYFIEDLGSTGGTKIDGETITEKDIHTGDVIEIGNYQLHFDSGIPEDERTVFETEEETVLEEGTAIDEDRTMFYEEPEAKLLVVKSDTLEGEIHLEEDETVFGRDEDTDITIEDKRISRKHCKISTEEGNFIISDLGSSNGTFVNGQRVTQKTLESGDRIQIGSNILEFRIEKPVKPQKRSPIGVLAKAALAIAILVGLSFGVYKIFLTPRTGKAQKVIMQKLWEHPTQAAVLASPSLGDLNGDGYINMVAADMNGSIHALDGRQGGLIWNSEFSSGGGVTHASPLLVDINERDGELDVVVGTTRKGVLSIDGGTMRDWSPVSTADRAVPSGSSTSVPRSRLPLFWPISTAMTSRT